MRAPPRCGARVLFRNQRAVGTRRVADQRPEALLAAPHAARILFSPAARSRSGRRLGEIIGSGPVLTVHGRDDSVMSWRASSAQLVELLPDSRLHVIAGCEHRTVIERPAAFWP
jgi:pimeloyl-ACP methyl ester carboxylesterase